MCKKLLCILLAAVMLCCCMLPASAAAETGVIRVKLHSDIAGLTKDDDAEHFIELLSDNVVYRVHRGGPVSVADYAGTSCRNELVAGRTYYIDYCLQAADGYTLPETISDGDVQIECGDSIDVYAVQITTGNYRNEDGTVTVEKGLRIQARVVVDGRLFQRITGFLYDIYLKIRAWSLY